MNREETKKAIEVMQAYVDGAEIKKVLPAISPHWLWDDNVKTYSIMPKAPREWWLSDTDDQPVEVIPASEGGFMSEPEKWIKVREVIE